MTISFHLILYKLSENEIRIKSFEEKLDTALDQARLNSLQESVESQNNRKKVLEYKTIDLEARLRRKNLIFRGFTESRNESCSDIVQEVLRNTMDIFEDSVIDRAHRLGRFPSGANRSIIVVFRDYASTEVIMSATHRLGRFSSGANRSIIVAFRDYASTEVITSATHRLGRFPSGANRSIIVAFRDYASTEVIMSTTHRLGRFSSGANRSIIVAFRDYASTEVIMSVTHKLAGTSFSVNRDFPPEITTARKELWPQYKQLKTKNPSAKVRIQFPAKPVMNLKVICDMFPEWRQTINTPRVNTSPSCSATINTVTQSRERNERSHSKQTTTSASHADPSHADDTPPVNSQTNICPWAPDTIADHLRGKNRTDNNG